MFIKLHKHLFPDDAAGTIQLKPSPSSGVPQPERSVPEHIAKMEFKEDFDPIRDHEVEQLPERVDASKAIKESQKAAEKQVEKAKEEPKTEKVKVEFEATKKVTKKLTPEELEAAGVTELPKEEPESEKLPKWLKPPKTKAEGEAVPKVEEGVQGREEVKQIAPKDKVTRDYTGYTQEEAQSLRQMSNEGFQLATKLIRENKELSKLKETTYLQHEEGFLLDPAYRKVVKDLTLANKEFSIYRSQLASIDKGEKVRMLEAFDAQGNPIYGQEIDPSPALTEDIRLRLMNTNNALNGFRSKIQEYPQQYKNTIQTDLQRVQQERKARFAWAANPDLLQHSVEIPGLGERTLAQIKDDVKLIFPNYMRQHPAVEVVSDLMVLLRLADAEIKELKNGNGVAAIKQEEAGLVEPSSQQKPKGDGKKVHGVSEFKDDLRDL